VQANIFFMSSETLPVYFKLGQECLSWHSWSWSWWICNCGVK